MPKLELLVHLRYSSSACIYHHRVLPFESLISGYISPQNDHELSRATTKTKQSKTKGLPPPPPLKKEV